MRNKKHPFVVLLIARALLLLFVTYYSDISLFQHTHIINGVTIVHSHFYGGSHQNNQSGNHTASELTLMAHAGHFVSLEGRFFDFDFAPIRPFLLKAEGKPIGLYSHTSHSYFSLRAPPQA